MQFVEVIANVPIRPTFGRKEPVPDTDEIGGRPEQTFHYHLDPGLEGTVRPGHLVWAPFGKQTIKAVIVRLVDHTPVPTRAIVRLARPEPVVTALQLELAAWIADRYVAPLSEAIKLFMPPGLLANNQDAPPVRAKRELQVTPLVDAADLGARLVVAGRTTPQATVLRWFLTQPTVVAGAADLMAACGLKSTSSLQTLADKGLLVKQDRGYGLAVPAADARLALLSVSGADLYGPIMEVLYGADGPVWKSDLAGETAAPLALLRKMQADGFVALDEAVRFRDPLAGRAYPQTQAPRFTSEQQSVWEALDVAAFSPQEIVGGRFLIHGVTGSGKTEVYLRAIAETLARGRQAIVLVPEIALTPQTVARFAGRFPGRVTVIHSGLSTGERYDVWRHIADGAFDIVVGPRSALFAPMARLGLIVIDEEHEASYKQNAEEWGSFTVFYDARAVAREMAARSNSILLLGSATPSMESTYAAGQGDLVLLAMPNRVIGHRGAGARQANEPIYAELPPVEVVDMRQELRAGNRGIFSRALASELHATLDAGEQAILFLNRRGSATFVMCRDCGTVVECKRCEIPLTYHERAQVLICHHCNRRYPIPTLCPNTECGSARIKYFGAGTQHIEEYVQEIAPRARVIRWDADAVSRKGRHAEILAAFAAHEADVMVGTQMIAKGLDLPMVTLVGVIAADVGLYLPDFRSGERTFQLLTQVAGRAGRSARGGRVVFQTYTPDHYAIRAASTHDYAAFYARELAFRVEHQYPPVRRMARLIYWNKNQDKVQSMAEEMAAVLRHRLAALGLVGEHFGILGPAPAFFARYRGYYRWQILLRAPDPATILRSVDIPFGWRIDIDPVSVL